MADLTDRRWIIAKGVLFAVIVVMAGIGEIIHDDLRLRIVLLLVCLWAACRFYYFLFHVLERYVGVEGRYAGILDLGLRLAKHLRKTT